VDRAFQTLAGPGASEIEIKHSRFFGHAEPVTNEEGFQQILTRIRAAHPDASHHAFAYRLGREGATARFTDAGEPGGTAGRPIMEVLIRDDVVDAAVIVTRYFGGTLLGSGGLTRAYGQAGAAAVRAAGLAHMRPHTAMHVTIAYGHYRALEQALQNADLGISGAEYTDLVRLRVRIPSGEEAAFGALVADVTAGTGLIEPGLTVYLPE
jgi:uncharacterized YigZ family protein